MSNPETFPSSRIEQAVEQSPTRESKEFMGKWRDRLLSTLLIHNTSLFSLEAGFNLAQGQTETALLQGIAAAAFAGALFLRTTAREK